MMNTSPEFEAWFDREWGGIFDPFHEEPSYRECALDAWEAAQEWQPIETAPKTGEDVLLYRQSDERFFVGYWDWSDGQEIWLDEFAPIADPTHWKPLSAPQ